MAAIPSPLRAQSFYSPAFHCARSERADWTFWRENSGRPPLGSSLRHFARHLRAPNWPFAELPRPTAGGVINDKRVERLWRREGFTVPARQPKKGRLRLAVAARHEMRSDGQLALVKPDQVHRSRNEARMAGKVMGSLVSTEPAGVAGRTGRPGSVQAAKSYAISYLYAPSANPGSPVLNKMGQTAPSATTVCRPLRGMRAPRPGPCSPIWGRRSGGGLPMAFSDQVDIGASKENAVNQELRAVDLIQSDRQPL